MQRIQVHRTVAAVVPVVFAVVVVALVALAVARSRSRLLRWYRSLPQTAVVVMAAAADCYSTLYLGARLSWLIFIFQALYQIPLVFRAVALGFRPRQTRTLVND